MQSLTLLISQILKKSYPIRKYPQNEGKNTLPTSLLEEKQYNPYLRLAEKYYTNLLEENNPGKSLKKLKLIQETYFK